MADSSTHPTAPPYATILPEDTAVRAGDTLQVQCLAHGTPPLHYTWDKVNGSLSARVAHRASLLRLSPAAPADTGTYRCLVTNRVGSTEAFARVAVHGEPIPGTHWCSTLGGGSAAGCTQSSASCPGSPGADGYLWGSTPHLGGAIGGLHPTQVILVLLGTTGALHPTGMMQVPLGTTGALHPFQVMLVKVGTLLMVPWWYG